MQAEDTIDAFRRAGQGQVFRFWSKLDEDQRARLLKQARAIDLREVDRLVDTLVRGSGEHGPDLDGLEPAPYIPLPANGGDPDRWQQATETGEASLRAGKVAAFTVAGGQGTRLGFDGPKGTFPVTPVRQASLFQVFSEKLQAAAERYGKPVPWFIMTSPVNHAATLTFFEDHDWFGLGEERVHLFSQGTMPAVDPEGNILLAAPDRIAVSPDGHGGSLRALVRSGATATMAKTGIEVLSYFQVDNVLVRCIDPAFIGFHLEAGADMSSKMVEKAYPEEKVGHFCVQDSHQVVIEYSDMPEKLQQARDEDGKLTYRAGSIAIHCLSRRFVEKVGSDETPDFSLPFHRADKKIPTVDEDGNSFDPEKPNGIKFEMFVFDALPVARNPVILETAREDDFSPVKNAEGRDSAETARQDQLRQWTRWLKAAGVDLETDETGLPGFTFEIVPTFADSERACVAAWQALDEKPAIEDGTVLG
ncbi:MAG: UTP--glucose-1-phosphate uridylyltransferase [Opitutales bacterium]